MHGRTSCKRADIRLTIFLFYFCIIVIWRPGTPGLHQGTTRTATGCKPVLQKGVNMNTIMPEGELLHRATEYVIKRISEANENETGHKPEPGHDQEYGYMKRAGSARSETWPETSQAHLSPQQLMQIIDEACMNFNLGPRDAETMFRLFQNGADGASPAAQPAAATQNQDKKK